MAGLGFGARSPVWGLAGEPPKIDSSVTFCSHFGSNRCTMAAKKASEPAKTPGGAAQPTISELPDNAVELTVGF